MRIKTNLNQEFPLDTLVLLQQADNLLEIYVGGELKETQVILPYLSLFERRSTFMGRLKADGIMPIRYARLHQHSYYSILDSLMSPKQMAQFSEYYSAITDHGVLTGYFEFYQAMKKEGQVPIIGMEAYCEDIEGKQTRNHLVLLVESEQGLQNLIKLRTLAAENFHYRPHLKWEWLNQHHEGLICLTACVSGEIPKAFRNDNPQLALKVLNQLIEVFGKNNVFLEIQRHGIEPEEKVNPGIEWLSLETGVPIVATTDSHYAKPEDAYVHGLVKQMTGGQGMDGTNYHLLTSDEMAELYADHPEYLDNTLRVAERCQLTISTAKERGYILPDFPLPAPYQTQDDFFEAICWQGFEKKYGGNVQFTNPEYRNRLTFEIETIKKMGFSSYFNIVADFIQYSKDNGILVGPGRGSACGSIVAYVLGITDVDPIEHHLLFERFLNPDRISMPDIDIDFQDDRREEVIDYVKRKYGKDSVSRIITIGRYKARGAIRAMQRVLGYPLSLAEKICKMIPNVPKMTIELAMEENPDLTQLYHRDSKVKTLIDLAKQIEGIPSHTGMHACGVIITKGSVSDYVPQCLAENTKTKLPEPTTELTMTECETLGLLKMDFLGLRALGVLGEVIQVVNKQDLTNQPLDFYQIPSTDLGFYQDVAQGRTAGVFQLESSGMVHLMRELYQDQQKFNPKAGDELFARLVAGIALYRPGPMKEIPNFISNMMNPDQIQYPIPQTASFLDQTYSVIVYQEQVMLMVRMLAGFSMGQADLIRKSMGKKIEEILDEYGHYFVYGSQEKNIKGCIANGIDEHLAKELWTKMAEFGKYGFNRSHATGYAMIAARSGYLAHYYPSIYMAATLNSYLSKTERIQLYMSKCQENGISVLPPHINLSQARFSAEGNAVRFGLRGLKHIGSFAQDIIEVREKYGKFESYTHFILSMAQHSTTRRQPIESLIYSGALDCFPGTRRFKFEQLDRLLEIAEVIHKVSNQGLQGFSYLMLQHQKEKALQMVEWLDEEALRETPEFDKRHLTDKEYEYAGFYITEHPLDPYLSFLYHEEIAKTSDLRIDHSHSDESMPEDEDSTVIDYDAYELMSTQSSTYQDGDVVRVAGVLKEIQLRRSKKNNTPFVVGELKDRTGTIKVSFFGKTYLQYKDLLTDDKVVLLVGKYEINDFGAQINVFELQDLEETYQNQYLTGLQVTGTMTLIDAREEYKRLLQLCHLYPGSTPVRFFNPLNQQHYVLPQGINPNPIVLDHLKQSFTGNQIHLYFDCI